MSYLPNQWAGPVKTPDQRLQEETKLTERANNTHKQENENAAEQARRSRLTNEELSAQNQAILRESSAKQPFTVTS